MKMAVSIYSKMGQRMLQKILAQNYQMLSKIFSNVTLDIIESARHEVFSETNKQKSYNKVINFLESI